MSRRPYVRPISRTGWWTTQKRYTEYMAREVTCVFIGAYTVLLVWGLMRLSQGQEAWDSFVAGITGPVGILFHLVCLAFAFYNTVTWFRVTPKAMPLMFKGKRVPGTVIVGGHWAAWAGVTLVVLIVAGI
ncbi:MAG: fumarate reductase subunit C [Rhodospirillaceae bacterium]|nr:fumarate reductase subunit C [Rhodospirillaceae bacterium]